MESHPQMPTPEKELRPQELCDRIADWSESLGYEYEQYRHAHEFGKIIVWDRTGGFTATTIPTAHLGRRLRKDQVRYVIRQLNSNWRD